MKSTSLLKDNLKILYKIRNTNTDFSSYAKKLMLGSKVEAKRLCALYLRRCEERKESKEGQLPKVGISQKISACIQWP